MEFEFSDDQVFQIESSELYNSVGTGIRTVEFIACLKANELDFIEAKSSAPNPAGGKPENFEAFITEISDKFLHSFDLYLSAVLGRHQDHKITGCVGAADNSKTQYKFILIIKGHQIEWLSPLRDALEARILAHRRIWKSKVVLMNEVLAQKYKLVKAWN